MSVADRLSPFGVTIFTEMSRLAQEHGAINLAQGFPDFDGPEHVKRAAMEAIEAGHGQYARMAGVPALTQALADVYSPALGCAIDADAEVTVTAGCTEAIAATLLGLVNPGDEVILFEPYYDSYRACVAMAGATPRFVTLRAPDFRFDEADLRRAITPRTRAILFNTPHNPTGRVFSRAELQTIADACLRHNLLAVADEVYERLVYEGEHVHIASLPGMPERTVTLSSLGKTFSLTGWKIGWAIAPPALTQGVRAAHQFLTFAVATPLQHAAAAALRSPPSFYEGLRREYRARRDLLVGGLRAVGLTLREPEGSYFIMADHSALRMGDDVEFCRRLTTEIGVAAIPPSAFYESKSEARRYARFAFCKKEATLRAALERLRRLAPRAR